MDDLSRLLEFDRLAREDGQRHPLRRALHARMLGEKGRHFVGIAGPRGAGKTVLLKQWAATHQDAFYLSADVLSPDADLFAMAKVLKERLGYRTLLLDEAHFNRDAPGHLKRIYDFLDMKVIFTSSVAMAIQAWAHDLARRARIFRLGVFSLREYLLFHGEVDDAASVPPLSMAEMLAGKWTTAHLRAGASFDEYLRGAMLPFALNEPSPLPLLRGILEKIVSQDIPAIGRPLVEELSLIGRLMEFVGRSAVDDLNYSTLSRNLGITKYKAEQYCSWLEAAFVVRRVLPAGTNVLREPKILLCPPFRLLYRSYEEAVGGLREDFFLETMARLDAKVQYLKGPRGQKMPDYLVELSGDRTIFEVGGKGKGRAQFKGIKGARAMVLAHSLTPKPGQIPLHLLGLLT